MWQNETTFLFIYFKHPARIFVGQAAVSGAHCPHYIIYSRVSLFTETSDKTLVQSVNKVDFQHALLAVGSSNKDHSGPPPPPDEPASLLTLITETHKHCWAVPPPSPPGYTASAVTGLRDNQLY